MELLGEEGVRKHLPNVSKKIIAASYCPGEGKINPMLATPVLAKESERLGTKFYLETTVISIKKEKKYFIVETNKGIIKSKDSHTLRMIKLEKAKLILSQGDIERARAITDGILSNKDVTVIEKQVAEELLGRIPG